MKRKSGIAILVCVAAMFAVSVVGYGRTADAPRAAEDEITLMIQLDLKEDIGLLLIDHAVDGDEGSGGMSNADKSMLRRDDTLYWTFDRRFYDDPADTVDLTVRFTVVTEYCDPNYDNIYPEGDMIPMEALSFRADFGGTYSIAITGDKAHGYQAALADTDGPSANVAG